MVFDYFHLLGLVDMGLILICWVLLLTTEFQGHGNDVSWDTLL